MKKKLFLPALAAALTLCFTPVQASAESRYWDLDYLGDTFTVETENFRYSTGLLGMELETAEECRANFMVSGLFRSPDGSYSQMVLTPINSTSGNGRGEVCGSVIELGWEPQLGDLIQLSAGCLECVPPRYVLPESNEDPRFEYLGNGIDIYGEEFKKVVRHELISYWYDDFFAPSDCNLILPGDLTEDDQVTIVDAIALNKSLMAGVPLRDCAKIAADVDQNGVIDETDSLNILKHIVGLVPDFSVLAE